MPPVRKASFKHMITHCITVVNSHTSAWVSCFGPEEISPGNQETNCCLIRGINPKEKKPGFFRQLRQGKNWILIPIFMSTLYKNDNGWESCWRTSVCFCFTKPFRSSCEISSHLFEVASSFCEGNLQNYQGLFFLCIRTIYLYGSGPNKNHQRSSTFLISHLLQLPIQLTILLTDERPVGKVINTLWVTSSSPDVLQISSWITRSKKGHKTLPHFPNGFGGPSHVHRRCQWPCGTTTTHPVGHGISSTEGEPSPSDGRYHATWVPGWVAKCVPFFK